MKKPPLNLLLLFGLFWVLGAPLQGQAPGDSSRYDFSISATSFSEALRQMQSQTGRTVYFRPEQMPDRSVDYTAQNQLLAEALEDILEGTALTYLLYRDYAVLVGPRDRLQASYAAAYFATLEEAVAEEPSQAEQTLLVGRLNDIAPSGRATVTGTLIDTETDLPIPGATLQWQDLDLNLATDENGQFVSEVPTGIHQLLIKFVGYEERLQRIQVFNDGTLTIDLAPRAIELSEVMVAADAPDANLERTQVGVTRIDMQTVRKLPSFMGETDVLKSLLLYPGVSTIGEGAIGFNVRGGEVDQNLILQDEVFLFNPSHALGFFSTLNTDLVRDVQLYKATMPAQYGGRLSSVLDVNMRDGNFDQFQLSGGVGPVTSRLTAEGPVIADQSSFLVGFRSSYTDWLLQAIDVLEVQRSSAFFYDLNLRYTHRFDERNQLIVAGYSSDDAFTYNDEFGFDYQTVSGQAAYKRFFSDASFNELSVGYSSYRSEQQDLAGLESSRLANRIDYTRLKNQLTWVTDDDLELVGGFSGVYYQVDPGNLSPLNDSSLIVARTVPREQALEGAVFAQATYSLSPALEVSGGLRFAHYRFLGPGTTIQYQDPLNPSPEQIIGQESYDSGETIATYNSLEPRLSLRYRLTPDASLKAGYSRTAQFVNQIFNADSPTPGNQFQLSTPYLEPFRAHAVSLGFFRNFDENNWETSLEVYGRSIDALYDFRDFAELRANATLETEILAGEGRAYGVEVSLKKNQGIINGMLNYTWSRTERQVAGINRGAWYPSNFDMPHNVSLVLNVQPNQRHTITVNFNYNSGRPITGPVGAYTTLEGLRVPVYSTRNSLRIPDYHRLDFAYTVGMGYRKDRRFKTSWTFSIYNVYGRENPFTVFYDRAIVNPGRARQLAILGNAFPALTFNFEWK